MNTQQSEQQQQQIAKGQHNYDSEKKQYVTAVYQPEEFPKWKYHIHEDRAQLVKNREDEAGLGTEWQDARPEPKNYAKSEDKLRQENESLKKQIAELKKEPGKQGLVVIGADH